MVAVHWPRRPPCPYIVKSFKNLLLQNRGCLGAESVQKSSVTGALPKLLKNLSYIDIWPFYGKVKFASLCICMSPITFVWENCWEFLTTSLNIATETNLLKCLAHLSTKCSWWAIVVSQCPSYVVPRVLCGVNNCFKSLLLLRLGQLTWYLVGSIRVTCSSKIAKIVSIRNQRWLPWPPSWKSIFHFFSWTKRPIDSKLAWKHQGVL